MKREDIINILIALALLFTLTGCMNFARPDNLTPEQIQAYKEAGLDVYSCFNIAGPPPAGGLSIITVPNGATPNIIFGSTCGIIQGQANQLPSITLPAGTAIMVPK